MAYPFSDIEKKWQAYWLENKTFRTPEELDVTRPKCYILDMFPYPSGAGLHVGHPEGYTATDITARFKRMNGYNVLHPMGWDAFGLPAEQYAVKTGTHPAETTRKNIDRFRQQLQELGFSYDWDREVNTTDPNYYKWTQWIFQQLYKRDLAYVAEVPVNWCPELGTVLSNEEVIDGKSEVGGHPVIRRPMRQWMLKITQYADRLLDDLEGLDWPESIKEMQRNWIGKSEGAEIDFPVQNADGLFLRVFTTRPDTLFGATYMVLAPEHEYVDQLTTKAQRDAVSAYRTSAATKSDLERTELQKEKSGVFTGSYAINPANGSPIPIWIADYVLGGYGTGAIMAVPGQDERDWEFAEVFDLPILRTVLPPDDFDGKAFTGEGPAINSGFLDGLGIPAAKKRIVEWLEEKNLGRATTNYRLRDWLFSRQRYWGEPFPVVWVDGEHRLLPEDALPLTLPEVSSYQASGTGESPLASIGSWVHTTDPTSGRPAVRETNTMPQWAGSCWYYLRFIDPQNTKLPFDKEKAAYWLPVDLYVGGAEHAVLHLLYARFWHKVLFDIGMVPTPEPFQKLVNQGMILGEVEYTMYTDSAGNVVSSADLDSNETYTQTKVPASKVVKKGEALCLKSDPSVQVSARAHKMSKSRGNVINPDEVVHRYGADSLRLYEMFMGPLEQMKPWSMKDVGGVYRFLNRVWRLFVDEEADHIHNTIVDGTPDTEQDKAIHALIKKVTGDIEGLRFNTAISAMMEFVNQANKWETIPAGVMRRFLLVLSPFAPHLAEELWSRMGHSDTLAYEAWPSFDETILREDTVEIAVQVNGKVRATITISVDESKETVLALAKQESNVVAHLEGKTLRKEIYVPGRIVNLVAN